ncbi:MAG: hypothetical protein R2695_01935 [Acidimicrobiales bacterium]
MRKPDPAIYHHTLGRLRGRRPQEVFVDDMESNVAAARHRDARRGGGSRSGGGDGRDRGAGGPVQLTVKVHSTS